MNAAHLHAYQGGQYTARQLAEIAGCSLPAMKSRLKTLTGDQAVALGGTRPVGVRGNAWRTRTWEHQGQQLTVAQLAALAKCPATTMRTRLRKHSPEQAVAMGPQKPQGRNTGRVQRHAFQGQMLTLRELAALAGCTVSAMQSRMRRLSAEASVALGGGGHRLYPYQGRQCSASELAKLAGVAGLTMQRRLEHYTPEQAVAMGALPRTGPRPGSGNGRQPMQVQMGDATYTIQQLADLAGCGYVAMYYRLRRHTPERAVAMGSAHDKHDRRETRSAPMPTPRVRAPRVATPKPKPPKPAELKTRRRALPSVAREPLTPDSALVQLKAPPPLAADAPAVIPADVKKTVAQPKPDHRFTTDTPPSTFGRIGQYLPSDTHLTRVYGGRK